MCCFVFVSPLSKVIWGYSKAAASVTWVNQRKFLKMTAAKLFLRRFRECGHTSFTIFFFCKNHTPWQPFVLIFLKLCLDFGNKNTEIPLQFSGKHLATCIIHNFNFTTHNYRLSALQMQSWYSISGVFLTVSEQDSKQCRRK